MISQTASALVLGFFIATAYGAGFHLLMGGGARRLLLYVGASWLGFAIGHLVGDVLDVSLLKLGALHLFSASLGAWIALIVSWWFVANEKE